MSFYKSLANLRVVGKNKINVNKVDNLKVIYFKILIGMLTKNGNKLFVFKTLAILFKKLKAEYWDLDPLDVLANCFNNLVPLITFRQIKKSGVNYKIPFYQKNLKEGLRIAVFWFVKSVSQRSERKLYERLFFEIIEINSYYSSLNAVNDSEGFEKNLPTFTPKSVLKKNDWYNLAILNRPFTKFIVS